MSKIKKFTVEAFGSNGHERVGILDFGHGNKPVQTPALWVGTRQGSVPNLIPETFEKLKNVEFAGFLIPFQHHANRLDVIKQFGKGVASYYGYKGHRTMVIPNDPMMATPSGYNANKYISLWDNGDRMSISLGEYCRGVKAMDPDCFVSLCDGDTPKVTSKKRISKSVSRTLEMLDETLLDHGDGTFLFAAIEGGYDEKARRAAATHVAKRSGVDGYLLDGFHLNGEDGMKVGDDMVPILKEVFGILPKNSPKMFPGMMDPFRILDLVGLGVDMFDSSLAIHMAESGRAFIFRISDGDDPSLGISLDLTDAKYKEDFTPVKQDCECYTCQKHTRGYIHHLFATNELLGPILLVIHNLYYYGTFFALIRDYIKRDKLELFKGIVKQSIQ